MHDRPAGPPQRRGRPRRSRRARSPRSVLARAAGLAVVVALTAGCAGLEDQARTLADEARSEAGIRGDEALEARLDQVRERFGGAVDADRVCELVADDRLTGAERGRLEVAVELGRALGLPDELATAGRRLLETTDGATGEVELMREACAGLGASLETPT